MIGLWSIFVTVFLAELGDKTQVATLLFAADPRLSRLGVFSASAGALALSSLLAVLSAASSPNVLSPHLLKGIAGGRISPDWPVDTAGPERWMTSPLGRGELRPGMGQAFQGCRWQSTSRLRGNGLLEMFHARNTHQSRRQIGFVPGERMAASIKVLVYPSSTRNASDLARSTSLR